MQKVFLVFTALALISGAEARPWPDQLGICYVMKDGQLASRQPCVVSTGYGAGGNYTSLSFGGKSYTIERSTMTAKETATLNEAAATEYLRENAFFNIVSSKEATSRADEELLWCAKSRYIDLCYLTP